MPARLSHDLLSTVLDTLPVRIFWKDRDSRFLGCNLQFARDCGFENPAEVIGKTTHEIRSLGEADGFVAEDLAVMESGRPKLNIEASYVHPDGTVRWIETNKLPLVDQSGATIGVLCTYHDITERVAARQERMRLIEELTIARDAAVDASTAKASFIANMSHELRTPLNAVIGYAEMLMEEQAVAPEAVKDVNQIVQAGRHLLGLVNDMLDMTKLTAGRMVAHQDIVAPTAIVGEVISMLQPMAAENHNHLRWGSLPPAFMTVCDAVKLRQCVFNLVSNACKFTRDGVIEVELVVDDEMQAFEVVVTDTGIGIAPAQLEHLFTPFSQVHSGLGRSYGGAGLGLAITRTLAQLMGGDVHAASTFGAGSAFTLRLPKRAVGGKTRELARAA